MYAEVLKQLVGFGKKSQASFFGMNKTFTEIYCLASTIP